MVQDILGTIPTNVAIGIIFTCTSVGIILTHVGTIPTLGEIIPTLYIMCRNLSYKISVGIFLTKLTMLLTGVNFGTS